MYELSQQKLQQLQNTESDWRRQGKKERICAQSRQETVSKGRQPAVGTGTEKGTGLQRKTAFCGAGSKAAHLPL